MTGLLIIIEDDMIRDYPIKIYLLYKIYGNKRFYRDPSWRCFYEDHGRRNILIGDVLNENEIFQKSSDLKRIFL